MVLVCAYGAIASADVQKDLRDNTRKVAEQTREIIEWVAARRPDEHGHGAKKFSADEIDALLKFFKGKAEPVHYARFQFVFDFLNFAKREGSWSENGWACCPSVRGIIRKWQGCSGMRYKPHLDWAMEVGLITMIREKWQRKGGNGRARTYMICVPNSPARERKLNYSEAIEYANQQLAVCRNTEYITF